MKCVICKIYEATEIIPVCKSCAVPARKRASFQRELDQDLTGQDQECFDRNEY